MSEEPVNKDQDENLTEELLNLLERMGETIPPELKEAVRNGDAKLKIATPEMMMSKLLNKVAEDLLGSLVGKDEWTPDAIWELFLKVGMPFEEMRDGTLHFSQFALPAQPPNAVPPIGPEAMKKALDDYLSNINCADCDHRWKCAFPDRPEAHKRQQEIAIACTLLSSMLTQHVMEANPMEKLKVTSVRFREKKDGGGYDGQFALPWLEG